MANVDIRLGHKNTAWFTTNSTLVLKDGQMVVCSDGANQGKYKIGDGTTQLSALTFYGGVSVSPAWGSITGTLSSQTDLQTALNAKLDSATAASTYQPIGSYQTSSTNLTSLSGLSYVSGTPFVKMTAAGTFSLDTNTYLTSAAIGVTVQGYNANTTLLGNTTTGSGSSIVLGTQPTFTTDITTPLIIGGSAVGSTIQYKGTSGNGTSTAEAHKFLVGNNGNLSALTIHNNGNVYIAPGAGGTTGGGLAVQGAFATTPTGAGFELEYNNGTTYVTSYNRGGSAWLPMIIRGSSLTFNSSNTTVLASSATGTTLTFSGAASSSGAVTNFTFNTTTNTGQTASTNIPNFKVTGSTKTWAAGTITNQYWNYFTANTAAFASASTITNSYGLFVEAATAGTNATITNNYAAGFSGNVLGTGNTSWGTSTNSNEHTFFFSNISTRNGFVFRPYTGSADLPAIYPSGVTPTNSNYIFIGGGNTLFNAETGFGLYFRINNSDIFNCVGTTVTYANAVNLAFNTTTGTKIGTATTQKIGFWNATPIVQPTTAVAAATVVSGTGGNVKHDDTFDGYTLEQIVKALRNIGLLA